MEYKKRLKIRIIAYIAVTACGLLLTAAGAAGYGEKFLPFGAMLLLLGIVFLLRTFWRTGSKERFSKAEIKENDERTLMIYQKSNSAASVIYTLASFAAGLLLLILNRDAEAQIVLYMVCSFIVIQLICRLILSRKY